MHGLCTAISVRAESPPFYGGTAVWRCRKSAFRLQNSQPEREGSCMLTSREVCVYEDDFSWLQRSCDLDESMLSTSAMRLGRIEAAAIPRRRCSAQSLPLCQPNDSVCVGCAELAAACTSPTHCTCSAWRSAHQVRRSISFATAIGPKRSHLASARPRKLRM